MTEQPIQAYEEDGISLLDILVTLAESWRLLVIGPLVAGVFAFGLTFFLPKTYESVAILRVSEAELALINTATVLDPLIEKFGLLSEFGGVKDDAREYLAKKIVGKLDKKTGFATVTATGSEPEKAQELGNAVVDVLLNELLPKGKNKRQVEEQILSNNDVIDKLNDAMDLMQKSFGKLASNEATMDVVAKNYLAMSIELSNRKLKNIELKKSLEIATDEVFVQQASLPRRKVSPKRSLFVSLAILCSGFVLLSFVFVRKSIGLSAKDPDVSRKLHAIRAALGFRTGANKSEC